MCATGRGFPKRAFVAQLGEDATVAELLQEAAKREKVPFVYAFK